MSAVERRLVAIVAADVAGYSRLMGAYEEGTIAQLRAHRAEVIEPKLDQYRGRIANTAGDSFLIEFASAVDAVRFSLDMQSEIANRNENIPEDQQLIFRIGINVGDVVAEGEDLLGDGVNVAARIEALADAGGICLSRSARDQVRDRLEIRLEDMGEVEVKNIARPVRVFRLLDALGSAKTPKTASRKARSRPVPAAIAIIALLAVGAGFWWWSQQSAIMPGTVSVAHADSPSIAVLPFTNLSGDKNQSYFADGITEDITTDLSKVPGLLVTSRTATLRFRNSNDDPKTLASKLGVGHLLEGSVRSAGDQIRITAKLINAKTGNQMWAERFDRDAQDIFAIQDEISERVVAQLSKTFKGKELKRKQRSYTPNLEAYDLYIRGRAQRIPPTPPNLKAAFNSFNKAIEIDPNFAGGYAGASFAEILAAMDSTNSPGVVDEKIEHALKLANKSVELDPEFGPGWGSLAEAHFRKGQFDDALEAIQKAIKFAPSDSFQRAQYGRLLGYSGRAAEGINEVKMAMRMSPDSLPMLYFLGAAYRANGEFQQAIDALVEHRKRLGGRILPAPNTQLIAAYAQAGKTEEAQETVKMLLKVAPKFSIKAALRTHLYKDADQQKAFKEALQKAGLPN